MSETDADEGVLTRDTLLLALVLFVGVAGTGVVRRQLGLLGYNELGRVVFVLGYGGMVFVVWYGWIRPLDITGPTENAEYDPGAGGADGRTGADQSPADERTSDDARPAERERE